MLRIIAAVMLVLLAILYTTNLGVLVWRGTVEDLGEGGPSFDCYFLGAMGPVRVGYFYGANSDVEGWSPAPRTECPRVCFLEKRAVRVGTREIHAWQCASEGRSSTSASAPPDEPHDEQQKR